MKRIGFALATAVLSTSVFAADLPVRQPAPAAAYKAAPPVIVSSWTGCYVGAGIGSGMWKQESLTTRDSGDPGSWGTTSAGGDGWFGTVQVGCDYQFAGDWVIGAFGDYDFGNVHGNAPIWESYYYGDEKQKWAASAGARLGYAVMPNLLTFVSAGWREAHFDGFTLSDPYSLTPPGGAHINAHTYSGWFVGSGFEYGIKWLPGLFWKTEYRYAQFARGALPVILDSTGLPYGQTIHARTKEQTIRSELVWRFNWR